MYGLGTWYMEEKERTKIWFSETNLFKSDNFFSPNLKLISEFTLDSITLNYFPLIRSCKNSVKHLDCFINESVLRVINHIPLLPWPVAYKPHMWHGVIRGKRINYGTLLSLGLQSNQFKGLINAHILKTNKTLLSYWSAICQRHSMDCWQFEKKYPNWIKYNLKKTTFRLWSWLYVHVEMSFIFQLSCCFLNRITDLWNQVASISRNKERKKGRKGKRRMGEGLKIASDQLLPSLKLHVKQG